jgi:hypothetical protein
LSGNEVFSNMPLHRQVFWVGRQWAVTGHGMQAVDQKQKSKFDIEVARLWDDDLVEGLSSERWFNLADFSAGLAIARARYPALPGGPKSKLAPEPALSSERGWSQKSVAATPLQTVRKVDPAKAATPLIHAGLRPSHVAATRTADASKPLQSELRRQAQARSEPRKLTPEAELAKSNAADYAMRVDGGCARFTSMWRVRIKR